MNKFISITGLKKHFKSGDVILKVIDDLHFSADKGKIIVITGESGVGKSTFLSLLGGLDYVTEGNIRIKSTDITLMKETDLARFRVKNIGFVFQHHYLLQEFNAYENIIIPYLIQGNAIPEEIETYINHLLDFVNLSDRKRHKPGQLSGGECQRIALLRALVNKPEIIVADEPTGNLDEKNTKLIFTLMKNLNKKYNFTFIVATHNMIIKKYCDELYLLKNGKLYKR